MSKRAWTESARSTAAAKNRADLVILVSAMFALACSGTNGPTAPVPEGPQLVDVVMREYAFDYDAPISAGRTVFRVHNAGRLTHRLTVFPLPDDLPPIDVQLRGTTRRVVRPFAGIPDHPPGTSTSFAVDLVAGQRYAFVCYVEDADGVTHAVKGMNSEFRAQP